MPSNNSPGHGNGRQRRLDDLFGDEPHLSPTMRARRLVEQEPAAPAEPPRSSPVIKLMPEVLDDDEAQFWMQRRSAAKARRAPSSIEEPDGDLTPTPRLLRMVDALVAKNGIEEPTPPARREPGVIADAERNAAQAQLRIDTEWIRLSEAAALLRTESPGRTGSRHGAMLERLRSEVLLRWLKEVPPRASGREREER